MRRTLIALTVLGSLATYAYAGGWRDFNGKSAPEITAKQWLNVPGGATSVKKLEGKVWLLNFVGMR